MLEIYGQNVFIRSLKKNKRKKTRLVCVALNKKELEGLVNLTESKANAPHQSRINNKLFNVALKHDESINGDSGKVALIKRYLSLIDFPAHPTKLTIEQQALHENCIFHRHRNLQSATGENVFIPCT